MLNTMLFASQSYASSMPSTEVSNRITVYWLTGSLGTLNSSFHRVVATVLTLIFLPTLYVTWFGWQERREAAKPKVSAETPAPQA